MRSVTSSSLQLHQGIKSAKNILLRYYEVSLSLNVHSFVLPCEEKLKKSGRVLCEPVENDANEFFIGIQFGGELEGEFDNVKESFLSSQSVGVLAEEISHFLLLSEALDKSVSLSHLDLEVMGEIDRFLVLMHWNTLSQYPKNIYQQWKNIHDICDHVFMERVIGNKESDLYIKAEQCAFLHLQRAFKKEWDASLLDTQTISREAKMYLSNLRNQLLAGSSQQRLLRDAG